METNSHESIATVWKLMDEMRNGMLTISARTVLHDLDFTVDHPMFGDVTEVRCSSNNLVSLPMWPNVLTVICWNNKLTSIPEWTTVQRVDCSYNRITSLPMWPNIRSVACSHNRITTLPLWWDVCEVYGYSNPLLYSSGGYPSVHTVYWHVKKLSCVYRVRRWAMRHHERKWRDVNASIACRPGTGIAYHGFMESIQSMC